MTLKSYKKMEGEYQENEIEWKDNTCKCKFQIFLTNGGNRIMMEQFGYQMILKQECVMIFDICSSNFIFYFLFNF